MRDMFDGAKRIGEDIVFDDLVDFSAGDEVASSVIRDASSEGTATQAGLQTRSLQSAMDNYAAAMNQSAIAKSTGLPVRTPTCRCARSMFRISLCQCLARMSVEQTLS